MEETEARPVFRLNSKEFYTDTLPEKAVQNIEIIKIIDKQIDAYRTELEIAQIAKDAIVQRLVQSTSEFEEVVLEDDDTIVSIEETGTED